MNRTNSYNKKCLCLFLMIIFLGFTALMCHGGEEALTVYVTYSGQKYHREGCGSLRRSKIAVSLRDAVRSGYGPCSICNPPAASALRSETPETRSSPPAAAEPLYRVNAANLTRAAAADITRMVPAEVIDHVDGDTVRVRIANPPEGLTVVETIRMLGVDTPETVHPSRIPERFGKEASLFTRTRLLDKPVYLAFDWDLRDHYGRLLAYIYTIDGGCFNAGIIREGYGHAYTRYPFQFMDEFKRLEQEARDGKRGLWGG
jgi:micrococcal nuclease